MNDINKFKVVLSGRIVCADGDSIAEMPYIYSRILNEQSLENIYVSRQDFQTDEVQYHNTKFPLEKICSKNRVRELSTEWDIPERFKSLDVVDYIKQHLKREFSDNTFTDDDKQARIDRVTEEFKFWKKRNLLDMLRTLIYIVNTFEENDIVWGTGRGSSCASYILYLIGLHQVDSVLYEIDIGEFFR